MINSMTGFGRYEAVRDKMKIAVEMKAVNHRYLDINIKIPKKLSNFESAIRTILKEYIHRGKVDVFVTYEDFSETTSALQYNEALAGEYLKYMRRMAETFHLHDDVSASVLARFPDVFVMEEQDADETELKEILEEAVHGAAVQFIESRTKEGENLKNDLMSKLDEMLAGVVFIETQSPQIIAQYREKLKAKVRELLEDKQLDDSRIAAEVTIFADKICVDEELVRLRSHIEAVKKELAVGGSIGRKLDFIAQEMNREANTILSKSSDLAVSDTGIELKTSIEKVREQIQNIE
ncbi:MAG: YicC family protein [Eubacterium sp.]|nr:YicC family protein [Eubacterium sp.]MCI8919707.1 YicC family protein [Eubacterium sp.]